MKFKLWLENEDYRGTHQPPTKEDAPLHDLTNTYPDDIYGPNGARYYGHGDPNIDNYTISIIQSARNKPNMQVKIYRAMPKVLSSQEKINDLEKQKKYIQKTGKIPPAAMDYLGSASSYFNPSKYYEILNKELEKINSKPLVEKEKIKINSGDWVSINRQYAVEHGQSSLRNNYRILTKTVPARTLFTNGDSIHEWGYNP